MIVTRKSFPEVLKILEGCDEFGLDTETYGLRFEDKLFMLILACKSGTFVFNFHEYLGEPSEVILSKLEVLAALERTLFSRTDVSYYISNAKFDMGMLAKEGVFLAGRVCCTNALGRVYENNHLDYGLAAQSKRYLGQEKLEDVEDYIAKNKLWSWESIPGKKKRSKNKRFADVPLPVMLRYAERDAELHLALGQFLWARLQGTQMLEVAKTEIELTKVLFDMEWRGIKLDPLYTKRAQLYETTQIENARAGFEREAGAPWIDSNVHLARVFAARGVTCKRTEKGNPSFTDDALSEIGGPLSDLARKIRYHDKRLGSFYSSFLYFSDVRGFLHPNIRQGGTETGRFSYSDPNLQQCSKEDEPEEQAQEFFIRGCFVPRDGFRLLSIDYEQQEFRLLLDYAGEHKLIESVLGGADVHQATADLCGITRKQAKTINFGLLYGMGTAKLAASLGIKLYEAENLKAEYFGKLPKVKQFIRAVIKTGEARGYVFNWAGRRCHIADRSWAYILPNHLIQGGGADVMKRAMVKIHELLKPYRTKMLLTVHDELVFELAFGEDFLVPRIQSIMETTYKPFNRMVLTTDAKVSNRNWSNQSMSKFVLPDSQELIRQEIQADFLASVAQEPVPSLLIPNSGIALMLGE